MCGGKKMKIFFLGLALSLALSTQAISYPLTPNPNLAEGVLCDKKDVDYVGLRYQEKIPYCERNVSTKLKSEIYALYNVPEKCQKFYTVDHIIPLSLGGDNSPENLWPEHKKVKATRPYLEQELYDALRRGEIKQKDAIRIILENKFHPNTPTAGIRCN